MYFLGRRTKTAIGAVVAGAVGFSITTGVVVAASAQTTPEPAHVVATTPPTSPPPVESLQIGQILEIQTAEDISFPIDQFRPVPEEQNLILKAEYEAMESCMARFGIAFDYPVWSVPAENYDYDRLFGILDLDEAQEFGYHAPGDVILPSGESAKSGKAELSTQAVDPHFADVAMGDGATSSVKGQRVPKGGCITEARSKLGDNGASQVLYEAAVNYGLEQSDRDSRVIDAFRSWSTCMEDAGFDYATPREAINDPAWATPSATEKEKHVATADIQCKLSTNLTGLRVAVASAWQTEFIESHAKEFAAARRGTEAQLAIATSMLQSSH